MLTAAAALVRRRFPLVLLAGAAVHGLESGDASAALPFGAYALRAGTARPAGSAGSRSASRPRSRWQPWQFTSGTEALNNVLS